MTVLDLDGDTCKRYDQDLRKPFGQGPNSALLDVDHDGGLVGIGVGEVLLHAPDTPDQLFGVAGVAEYDLVGHTDLARPWIDMRNISHIPLVHAEAGLIEEVFSIHMPFLQPDVAIESTQDGRCLGHDVLGFPDLLGGDRCNRFDGLRRLGGCRR